MLKNKENIRSAVTKLVNFIDSEMFIRCSSLTLTLEVLIANLIVASADNKTSSARLLTSGEIHDALVEEFNLGPKRTPNEIIQLKFCSVNNIQLKTTL